MYPTLLGILPYTGIGFALNEYLKHYVALVQWSESQPERRPLSTAHKFACSYVAAMLAQSTTYPLDTIRRRMQTEGYLNGPPADHRVHRPQIYTGVMQSARMIIRHEGWRGLYKGLSVNWLRVRLLRIYSSHVL